MSMMASSSSHPQRNEEHHELIMPSSSLPRQNRAFSGIEPPHQRRNVSESYNLYDVFINHRGPDVKNTLARQLHESLVKLNIRAFLDSEDKELGNYFTSIIETAIHSAAVHIAIFSRGYAESPWCLEELVLMSQSRGKIIPVFYDVNPCALRHIEKGVYGQAFAQYQEKGRHLERLDEWKKALKSVSFIAGEEFNSAGDCENIVSNIVSAVEKEVQRTKCINVATYPVGLPKLVEDFEKRCIEKSVQDFERLCEVNIKRGEGKAKIVGIFGMGGLGKTTLSRELFNRKCSSEYRKSFLFDVREASAKSILPSLQMKLLKDLFNEEPQSFTCVEDGANGLRDRIRRSLVSCKFIIVVDDIDHLKQLEALCITDMLHKFSDCLVIVTTRDVDVLINAGITVRYDLKGMDKHDAKELFCWHAFRQPGPESGYDDLVDHFVHFCDGLPLSIQVMGSHVFGHGRMFWELELKKVKKTLPRDILKSLRISIETLDNEEKQIFMDIACFFIGEITTNAMRMWEAAGWSSQHALQRLKNKCLVEEISEPGFRRQFTRDRSEDMSVLRMHDHLRDLGREMADEVDNPRRLWRSQDLKFMESKGFKNIITTERKFRCLHSFMDPSLGFLVKFFLGESNNTLEPSTDLQWLELENFKCVCTDIPPWIPLQNLQGLNISNLSGDLLGTWQRYVKEPLLLKELVIHQIHYLRELSLNFLGCLEKLEIDDCSELKSVTGISDHKKLAELNITRCGPLDIHDCLRLENVTGISDLVKCGKLEFQESSLCHLHSLKKVTIRDCDKIDKLSLHCPEELIVDDCPSLKSVTGLSDLTNLVKLNISRCRMLQNISFDNLKCIKLIKIHDCRNLESVTGISDLGMLEELNIIDCGKLDFEESSLCHMHCPKRVTIWKCNKIDKLSLGLSHCLEELVLYGCRYLKSVTGLSDLTNLVELTINYCGALELQVLSLSELPKLIIFHISYCQTIEELSFLLLSSLKWITIESCGVLKSVEISDLTSLGALYIRDCNKIEEVSLVRLTPLTKCFIPDAPMLKKLEVKECVSLQNIDVMLWNLVKLDLSDCPRLEKLEVKESLNSLERLQLFNCSKTTIWNCIIKMKKVPSELFKIIGRAVGGWESSLNANFFVGYSSASPVTYIGMEKTWNHEWRHAVGAIILCAVVRVNSCASAKTMNEFIKECDWPRWLKFEVRQGEWVIALVTMREDDIENYIVNQGCCFPFDYLCLQDVSVKTVSMPVMKGEENKILNMLCRIVDELYQA